MNRPKRHHYLPEFYLEGFAREGRLAVFDRKKCEFRYQSPANTAVESGFYTVVDAEGKKSEEVERLLGVIEGYAKPIIDALAAPKPITPDQRQTLAAFVATLYLRTPGFRRTHDALHEAMMKHVMRISFRDKETAEAELARMRAAGRDVGDITPEQAVEVGRGEGYSIEFSPNESIKSMLHLLPKIAPMLADLEWHIVHAPQNKSFVTADEPFVLVPPNRQLGMYGVGIITPGAVKAVPLSQNTCLIMGDPRPGLAESHVDATADGVRAVNLTVTANCERFVIGPIEALVRSLVKATAVDRTEPRPRVQVG